MRIIKTEPKTYRNGLSKAFNISIQFDSLEASKFLFERAEGTSDEWKRYKARTDAERAQLESQLLKSVREALKSLGAFGEVTDTEPKEKR